MNDPFQQPREDRMVSSWRCLAACVLAFSCAGSGSVKIDDAALGDETRSADWLGFGRTYSEQRFSPLSQIDTASVAGLKVDWYLDLPEDRGLVSTPLVANGVLYFIGSMNVVRAVDAASGKLLWSYDPRVADRSPRTRVGWDHSRGIALWKDKVILATWDGRLIAVRAADGREVWSTMTIDTTKAMYITGAPKVFKNKVLIGNGGTEHGPSRGYVTAYDAETGKQAWRFYIVPGNPADGFENAAMEMAAKTWTGEWWKVGGGGNAWHGFTYDRELDRLYIGTGNGSPWNQKIRSPGGGDNLFLSSIVALDPDSGTYRWHYQDTPGETWDFNSNMDIILADLQIGGRTVKSLLHAPKNGFFYVIDREAGKLISADPFAEVSWASKVDPETGRPVEVPGARYEDGYAEVTPGPTGAHSWHAMSYNPGTGLAYFPVIHFKWFYADSAIQIPKWRSPNWRVDFGVAIGVTGVRSDGVAGSLLAWDPVNRKRVWEVPLEGSWQPGTMTTAGNLVFQGRADGHLVAYDARTGKELWKFNAGSGISAPPITYSVGGKQYVALLVGWGGVMAAAGGAFEAARGWAYGVHKRRLIAFSLEGVAQLPASPAPVVPAPLAAAEFGVSPALAAQGMPEYESTCGWCHGPGGISAGMAPDLRASGVVLSETGFANVVRGGERRVKGMPQFAGVTDEQLLAMRHYIRQQAEAGLRAARPAP
jgi:quinohemoprotein ethanol dehydrogenase